MATPADHRPPSPSPSQLPPIPGSPTYSYASTANQLSSFNLPLPPPPRPAHAVLTKADLDSSQTAYAELLATAKSYRQALATLSSTASSFGAALESCARLKEARADTLPASGPVMTHHSFNAKGSCTADMLLASSGVHHLIANHQQILSETVYRAFEVPLLHELDKWRAAIADEDEAYSKEVAARSKEIRKLEKEGLKMHRQTKRRDVAKFREHLVQLTNRLDGMTLVHAEHARTLLRESQETSTRVLEASCSLVRAEVDIFEGLARKGWSGGGLDDVLEKGRDLFASTDEEMISAGGGAAVVGMGGGASNGVDGTKLFSILPPKSILAVDTASDSGVRGASRPHGHGRADSLLVDTERYQSLAGAIVVPGDERTSRGRERTGDGDEDSIFSEFNQHQSRGVRPFSPQPIRRHPTDVALDPESLLVEPREPRGDADHEGDDAPTLGTASVGHQGVVDEDDDEDHASPWKDEGLRRPRGSEDTVHVAVEVPLPGSRTATGMETGAGDSVARDPDARWNTDDDDTTPSPPG